MPTSIFVFLLIASFPARSKSACTRGCDLALGSYYVSPNLTLSFISALFSISPYSDMLPYNPLVSNKNSIQTGSRINVPFPCDCINGEFLGSTFNYVTVRDDTYDRIAADGYANLTTTDLLVKFNIYPWTSIPKGGRVRVTVDCFCGDQSVSMDYGLFLTHPLRVGDSLTYLADLYSFSGKEDLLERYNPGKNFSAGDGIVFIPTTDPKGSYHPLASSNTSRLSGGAIVGIVVVGAVGLLVFACLSVLLCRRKKAKLTALSASQFENMPGHGLASRGGTGGPFPGITVDKSVEFSYEELAKATNDFHLSNKIGEGGFGAVYYAELRGEKTAIKKMDMHASREFLSELNVLTRVHHLNLVRLIGFCTESSLFLVYEYVENGNLNEHLCGSRARDPLSWSARIQIALDSARGLEYIHEHTVPVYTHRDIKSANILIDKKFHGKVADFGLAKLTDVGSSSLQTRLVGTFGYMPPEDSSTLPQQSQVIAVFIRCSALVKYARYGDVSPKVDVYAFGVVLYELISAKNAIVNANESIGLVALFEGALKQQEPTEELWHLVDAGLGDNYPAESVLKMAQLARACTQENPQLRPSMRSIVVALMTLSSNEDQDMVGSFYMRTMP